MDGLSGECHILVGVARVEPAAGEVPDLGTVGAVGDVPRLGILMSADIGRIVHPTRARIRPHLRGGAALIVVRSHGGLQHVAVYVRIDVEAWAPRIAGDVVYEVAARLAHRREVEPPSPIARQRVDSPAFPWRWRAAEHGRAVVDPTNFIVVARSKSIVFVV